MPDLRAGGPPVLTPEKGGHLGDRQAPGLFLIFVTQHFLPL